MKSSNKIIATNWKMNGDFSLINDYVNALLPISSFVDIVNRCELVVFPQSIMIDTALIMFESMDFISIGAQDCSIYDCGAFTGEISAGLIKDLGCKYCLVGHSERRRYHGETLETSVAKMETAIKKDLYVIMCLSDKDIDNILSNNQIQSRISSLLETNKVVFAYEPISSIGTGVVASIEDIKNIVDKIKTIFSVQVMYGGSVDLQNFKKILPITDGLLIGGASLNATTIYNIIKDTYDANI